MDSSGRSETRLHVDPPQDQGRLSVFFRVILILPQLFVSVFLSYAMLMLTIPGWFITLFTRRNPFHRLTAAMLAWYYRVNAYGMLLTDSYPPFRIDAPLYPVDVAFEEAPLGRLSVFFRLILAIPAYLALAVLGSGMSLFAFAAWVITLFRGKMPVALHGALSAQLRFALRVASYANLLQGAYPGGILGDRGPSGEESVVAASEETAAAEIDAGADTLPVADEPGETPAAPAGVDWALRLSAGARRIVVISLILGVAAFPLSVVAGYEIGHHARTSAEQSWSSTYRARVATLNGDTKRAVAVLTMSPPNWPAIDAACHAVSADLQALATVPQYPSRGPDQSLIGGFAAIYRGDLVCLSAVEAQRSANLAAASGGMLAGSGQLVTFLSSIPLP